MSKELYVHTTVKGMGIDEDGAFAVVETEVRTDKKKDRQEYKLYIGGRTWFSNTHDDYAYSNSSGGKTIIHNPLS